jgi:hypothetical protein
MSVSMRNGYVITLSPATPFRKLFPQRRYASIAIMIASSVTGMFLTLNLALIDRPRTIPSKACEARNPPRYGIECLAIAIAVTALTSGKTDCRRG